MPITLVHEMATAKQRRWAAAGLVGAIVLGAWLRLVWVRDIEYKADEAWTFERTQRVGVTEPWPWVGMVSSTEVVNPGMSLWVFVGLSKLAAAHNPTTLARAVQVMNIGALIVLVWFALRVVAPGEREPWLWAAALGALNPLAVLFQRKIWPPSVFPLLTMLMLVGWWRRERRWGALLWGLIGACLGQIHMSGFFFVAGFALWAFLFDRKGVRWGSWLTGIILGSLPLLPWLGHVVAHSGANGINGFQWYHLLEGKFWTHWLTEPLGISVEYALHRDFADFLCYPLIGGRRTYGMLLLHGIIVGIGALLVARLWYNRSRWRIELAGRGSSTALTLSAACWGFGILLTAAGVSIHRHYLIILFPLPFVWLARAALACSHRGAWGVGREAWDAGCWTPHAARHTHHAVQGGRGLLLSLCVTQLLITIGFLSYVHVNQRPLRGDYGTPYGAQPAVSLQRSATQALDDRRDAAGGLNNLGLRQ
jgi:hypothetical protein